MQAIVIEFLTKSILRPMFYLSKEFENENL